MRRLYKLISAIFDGTEPIGESIFTQHRHLPRIALLLTLLTGGFSTIPPYALLLVQSFAASPMDSGLFATYYGETPLSFFLGNAFGATTLPRYLGFCGFFVLLSYLLVYVYAKKRKSSPALLFLLLFATHPIAYILHTWIGMMDGITVVCTVVLLFESSILIMAPVSLLLMLNHTAAPFIAVPLIVLRALSHKSGLGLRHVLVIILSLLAGKLLLMCLHNSVGQAPTRLSFMLNVPWTNWINISINHLPSIVYSMCYALWLPVICMLVLYFNDNRRLYGCYLLSMAGFYAITLVTCDTTRVFALLSWGPTLYCLLHTWELASDESRKAFVFRACTISCALFGWAFPRLFVWDGKIQAPWMGQLMQVIWQALTGATGGGG